jgi:signal transduction histidine kinase
MGFVAAALSGRLALDPILENNHPYTAFELATVLSACFGGAVPGLLALCLGYLAADWYFIPPRHSLFMTDQPDMAGVTTFYFLTGLLTALGGMIMRSALAQAVEAREQLVREVEERRKAQEAKLQQQRRLEVLHLAADRLLSTTEPEAVLHEVYGAIADYFQVDGFIEYEVSPNGAGLDLRSCVFVEPGGKQSNRALPALSLGQGISGRVAATRQPALISGVQSSEEPETDIIRGLGVRAYACEPLVVSERLVGTLAFASRTRERFESLDQELFATLANYIALTRERLRLRRELERHAQDLEETVEERTARLRATIHDLELMSYNIMHDMRAPLRSIQSFADLIEEDTGRGLNAAAQEHLSRIRSSAERMDALIRDVLSYAGTARSELPMQPIELTPLIRGIVESYPSLQTNKTGIQIDPNLPRVLGNQAALTQCFSNLLGNAVKFVPPGKAPTVQVSATRDSGRVRVMVKDNGIGVPPECQEKIFGMFTRLSKQYEGTGIGLAIVRKAAERMGGQVGLESQPGQGSCFWLELKDAA